MEEYDIENIRDTIDELLKFQKVFIFFMVTIVMNF